MHSSNERPTASREILLKEAEMFSWRTLRSQQPVGYEMQSRRVENNLHKFEEETFSQRISRSSLHSSSSNRYFRPSSSPKEKLERNLNNRQEKQKRPSTQMNSRRMYSPRDSQQRRSSIALPIRAHSHLDDSADGLSPRQLPGKSSLSKYKPLPAIGTRNQGTSPVDIFETTSDYQNEDQLTKEMEGYSSSHTVRSQTVELTRESSPVQNNDHLHLVSPSLDLQETSTKLRQSHECNEDQVSKRGSPQISTAVAQDISAPIALSAQPSLKEAKTLLAVKLPNGRRIQHFFRLTDPLRMVRRFAEISSKHDLTDFKLVKSFPREILDLERTLEENDLSEKTLLHLEKSSPL